MFSKRSVIVVVVLGLLVVAFGAASVWAEDPPPLPVTH